MAQEDFQNDEFHQPQGEWCFLCKNITSTDPTFTFTDHHHHDSQYRRSAVKILISYLLNSTSSSSSCADLQSGILSSFKNGKCSICAVCLCRARNLLELHLELEKIQMLILDDLKYLQDYLRSSVPVVWKDDVVMSRFQDVLQREFLCRNLSDGTQVRLERLRYAGYKNASSSFLLVSQESENFIEGDGGIGYSLRRSMEDMMFGDRDGGASDHFNNQDVASMEDIKPLALVETQFHGDDDDDDVEEAKAVGGRNLETCDYDNNEEEQAVPSESEEWLPQDNDANQDEDDLEDDDDDDKPRHSMAKRPKRTLRLRRESDKPRHSLTTTTRKRKRKVKRNLLWKCDICRERIPAKEVRGHMKSHQNHNDDDDDEITEETLWECDICLENIPAKEMKLHLKSHPEFEKIYKCGSDKCPQNQRIYGSYKGLIWHYLRAPRPHPDTLQLPCLLCPAEDEDQSSTSTTTILYKKAALCKHLYEIHHPTHKKLPCKVEGCPKEFYNPLGRGFHSYQEHSSVNKCEVCLQEFKTKADLNYHLKSHKDPLQLQCASCPKVFKNEITLRQHERTHEEDYIPEKVPCPDCSSLISKQNLRKHRRLMHTEDTKQGWLACDMCKARVKTPSRLALHKKRMHEQTKWFQCSHCPKQFKSKNSLRFHEKGIHVETEMVQCPYCPKMTIKFSLAPHIRQVHRFKKKEPEEDEEGNLTFPCPQCPFKATTKLGLNGHMNWHREKTLKCQFCEKTFAAKRSLVFHEKTHSMEQRFQCDMCPEAFFTKNTRYRHKIKVHGCAPLNGRKRYNSARVEVRNHDQSVN